MVANAEAMERPQQTTNTGEAQAPSATSNGLSAATPASAPSIGANGNQQATQLLTPATAAESSAANPQNEGDNEDSDEDEGSEDSYCLSHYDPNGDWVDNNELDLQIERKNRLYVMDEEGVMKWLRYESSYTPAAISRCTDYHTLCLYDFSSPGELRKYVRARGLPDPYPEGLTLRYFYIRLLEQDDKVKSFRFLDLPAEMRNLIYAQLLIYGRCPNCPRVHEACHTGILRANKQVYKEAKNILYDDNEIRCTFGASGFEDGDPANFFSWIHVKETRGLSNSMDNIFLGMSQIPDWFRRIQCLRINLDFSGGSVGAAGFKLQACLLNLASFLMDEHRLKKLKIVITNSHEDPDGDDEWDEEGNNIAQRLDATLYPLRRLRGLERVELIGLDEGLAKSTIADMQKTSGPVFNTLLHFNNLREEAKGYARLLESIDPGSFGLNEPFGDEGRLSNDIEMLVEELGDCDGMDEMYDAFADAPTETNTRRKMEELRDCLAKLQFLEFERRKKEFIKLRKTRTAYQMKSKWVYVDGKKKKSEVGLRRDWQPRLDDYDEW